MEYNIKKDLTFIREILGITQAELANILGAQQVTISRNEKIDTEIITTLRYKAKCQKECAFKSLCDGGCRYERIINFPNDWKCEVCSHSCDIYEALYNVTKEFLDSLDDNEREILLKIINSYNLFKVSYDNGLSINRNERML